MVCAYWELLVLTDFWVFGPSCAVFVNVFNSSDSAGFVHYKHILRGERWDGERDRVGNSAQTFPLQHLSSRPSGLFLGRLLRKYPLWYFNI